MGNSNELNKLYIITDLIIWASYFFIGLAILQFIRKKPGVPLKNVFRVTAVVIFVGGMTYLIDALQYVQSGILASAALRTANAAVSCAAVVVIYKFLPLAIAMKTPSEFETELTERKKSEQKFKGLLESAPDAMVITQSDGKILMVNAQTENLFGFMRHEIIGKNVEILIPSRYHNRHEQQRKAYATNPHTRPMGAGLELFGYRKDTSEFPVEVSLSPLKVSDEDDPLIIAAIRDITSQKNAEKQIKQLNDNLEHLVAERTSELENALNSERIIRSEIAMLALDNARLYEESREINLKLEKKVAERTSELEAINREMEAFSYSVSHDLRAPLRSIEGFSEKLLKSFSHQIDPQAKDYFERIVKASRNMSQLIDDLLKLSRLARAVTNPSHSDLTSIANSIVAELRASEPARKAEVIIQTNMTVKADINLIQIALQNLFDNAWKYSRTRPVTKIEFGKKRMNGDSVFYIMDNGVGFDMENSGQLFKLFQRLHSSSEFEGTGIGLTIVQRIIQRHNGRIWAESELNKGATFFFTVKNDENETTNAYSDIRR